MTNMITSCKQNVTGNNNIKSKLQQKSSHFLGNQNLILFLEHNYSTIDKEFWPFSVDPGEGSLAIV